MNSPAPERPVLDRLCGVSGDTLAVLWGAAEASFFFVVPDVLLTLTAAFRPRRSLRQMALSIVGSVMAGLAMFAWAASRPEAARSAVERVPFVRAAAFPKVEGDFTRHGVWALCLGPASGVPYKVYAVLGPRWCSAGSFAAVSIPARAERLVITWAQFALLGWCVRRWARRLEPRLAWAHAAYWVGVYAWYWSRA